MIALKQITEIAQEVARKELPPAAVEEVKSEDTVDSRGDDAVKVTIVLKPDIAEMLDGDALLDTLVKIQEGLQKAGEERLPIVEYATKKELEEGGDT
jgi:hypothetical protein